MYDDNKMTGDFIDSKVMFVTICLVIGYNYITSDNNIIIKKNIQ
jgi:hypothetical protein|tara:strand:- start:2271 stop:2402 length:132 start_codon:yes stop_codon:yes gene_type:complete